MRWIGLFLALLLLGGCRIEPREPDPAADSQATADLPATPGDDELIDSTEAAVARPSGPPVVAPSGLMIPVDGVRSADLVDTFTDARGQNRRHDALDILAPRGTPVRAATDGRVLRLFTSDNGGLTVYQLGADGRTVYYYAHLDRYASGLAAEQTVRRGQVLGYVGDTGNAVPGNTHLHFAIWAVADPAQFWDGQALNPYPLLGGQ